MSNDPYPGPTCHHGDGRPAIRGLTWSNGVTRIDLCREHLEETQGIPAGARLVAVSTGEVVTVVSGPHPGEEPDSLYYLVRERDGTEQVYYTADLY